MCGGMGQMGNIGGQMGGMNMSAGLGSWAAGSGGMSGLSSYGGGFRQPSFNPNMMGGFGGMNQSIMPYGAQMGWGAGGSGMFQPGFAPPRMERAQPPTPVIDEQAILAGRALRAQNRMAMMPGEINV